MASTGTACKLGKTLLLTYFIVWLVLNCMFIHAQATQRFCGNNLAEALNLLCPDGYKHKLSKRTGKSNEVLNLDISDFGKSSSLNTITKDSFTPAAIGPASSPFLSSFLYNGMMLTQAHRRQRRRSIGAYDECCRKPCSVAEMTAYCHVP